MEAEARTHLEGQVGSDGDASTQVDVAVPVAHEQCGIALGLRSHPDAAAVLRARPQPSCKTRAEQLLWTYLAGKTCRLAGPLGLIHSLT